MTITARATKALNLDGRREWFRIENAAGDGPAKVYIYDAIGGWFGITARELVTEINALDVDEFELHVNSPGGEVYDGIAIRNAVKAHKAKVTTYVDGLAASAASYIALAGDEVVMMPNSELMIHDASGLCLGWAQDMQKMADDLNRISDNIASMYAAKAGGESKAWRALMLAETWYSADEAVTAGLADRVEQDADPEQAEKAKARFDLEAIFNHVGRSSAPDPMAASAALSLPVASAAGSTSRAVPESGDTTQEGDAVSGFTPEQLTSLRQKLGVQDDADADQILGALSEALEERAEPVTAATTPPGTVVVDEATLEALRADAASGAEARRQQEREHREALVDSAVRDGRIPPARRDHWVAMLAADAGAAETLASLAKGTIPTSEAGHDTFSDSDGSADIYADLYGDQTKEA